MAKEIPLSKVSKEIEKKIEQTSERKDILNKVADLLATTMRVRIRRGFGCDRLKGEEKRFRALKESTVKQRARLKKQGKLLSGEGVSRSNLTATGKLTDAIQGESAPGQIIIRLEENRDDGSRNKDINRGQEDNNRSFFNISKKEYRKMSQDLVREVKSALKRI